jgi:AraC-like DNA-binding protein
LRVGPAIGVLRAIESLGFDPAVALRSAEVEPDVFSHPDNLIDIVELGRVAVAAQHLTGRDEIGILAARLVEPGALGLVEHLMMEGPDLRTSLRNLVRFLHYHDRPALLSMSVLDGDVHLRYEIRDPGFAGANIIHDCSIGIAYRLVQALCGPLWSPTAVLLSRREPRDPEPYRNFFNKRVQFSAAEDAVVFGEEWLDWKVGQPSSTLSNGPPIDGRHLPDIVRQKIATCLGRETVSGDSLAAELCLSRRTLDRRLAEDNTSWGELLDEVRFSRAQRLLSAGNAPLCDIAFALGYSDQTAFSRSFRRWSGVTPRDWRYANAE